MATKVPKQRTTSAQKDKNWRESTVDALISNATFGTRKNLDLLSLYSYYNGTLKETDYSYVTNPYNSQSSQRKYPAKLRNYNIIKPVIDLLLGEKAKRPRSFQVVARNSDLKSRKLDAIKNQVTKNLQQQFINELNEMGVETGQDSQQVQSPKEVEDFINANYHDTKAVLGQQALDYLSDSLDLEDELQDAFFDWLVTGETYSYKGVNMDDPEYEIISPVDIDYHKSPSVKFIEDGDWAVVRRKMSLNAIVDSFYDVLTPADIKALEGELDGDEFEGLFDTIYNSTLFGDSGDDLEHSEKVLDVYHVTWKTYKKVGILSYIDDFGFPQTTEVSDTYKPDAYLGESVEWFWIQEVWEGFRISKNVYVDIKPSLVQRRSINNLSECKLPYNGRSYSDRKALNTSIVEIGRHYQMLYNIFHYRLELTVAKNKDKIALIEMNTIPKRHGWDEEKFMYFADAMGFAFIDSTATGKDDTAVTFNQFQVLDMSLSQYIGAQFELLMAIKEEWEETIGISRQRKGQVMASDGSGATERSVFQSSLMTEELFRRFEKFEQKEFQGLLDVSKMAWRNGKKAMYVTSDFRNELLDIEGPEYMESDLGVFAKNSGKEANKLETFKAMAMSFAQNGSQPSTVAEILDTDNFANIKRLVKDVEDKQQKLEQSMAQAEQAAEQQKLQSEMQMEAMKQEHESTENQLDRDNQIRLKEMDIEGRVTDADRNNDGIVDANGAAQAAAKDREIASKERIENRKLDLQEKALKQQKKSDS